MGAFLLFPFCYPANALTAPIQQPGRAWTFSGLSSACLRHDAGLGVPRIALSWLPQEVRTTYGRAADSDPHRVGPVGNRPPDHALARLTLSPRRMGVLAGLFGRGSPSPVPPQSGPYCGMKRTGYLPGRTSLSVAALPVPLVTLGLYSAGTMRVARKVSTA